MATLGGMERGPRTPPGPGAHRAADPGVVAAAVTVREATRRALDVVAPLAPLEVALADARGCLLAQDVQADTPLPPVDLADGDGYAVRAAYMPSRGRRAFTEATTAEYHGVGAESLARLVRDINQAV